MVDVMILRGCSQKKMKTNSTVGSLTDDLLTEILLRISSAISICQCKTVCKRWNSVISSACFRHHAHQRRIPTPSMLILNPGGANSLYFLNPVGGKNVASVFDQQRFYLLASCNDLLLLSPNQTKADQGTYYLWNSFTQQLFQLPPIPSINSRRPRWYVNSRFGFVSKFSNNSHNFRVIRLPQIKEDACVFDMYSSETSTWTEHEICPEWVGKLINTTPFSFGGKLYWYAKHQIIVLDPFKLENMACTIAYPLVPIPPNISNLQTINTCVFGVVEGRLRLFDLQRHIPAGHFRFSQHKCLLSFWQLNNSTESSASSQWTLVDQVYLHELVSLDSMAHLSERTYIFPLAMDTKDEGVVYLLHGSSFLSCNMKRRELQHAAEVKVGSGVPYIRYYFQLELPWIPTQLLKSI